MEKIYPYTSMFMQVQPVPPPVYSMCTYYDNLVVVDFEATCDAQKNRAEVRPLRPERPEIIQFPAVLIDCRSLRIVDCFDSYVQPKENSQLSEFCTNLTGITQSMVDKSQTFPKVLRRFEKWLRKHGLSNCGQGRTYAIVTDGSYDIGHFLYKQLQISNLPYPAYARRWVNIRTIFSKFYGCKWYNLKSVLDMMGQPFEGRPHNGLDDARNIAKVLLKLLVDGCVIAHTEKILLDYQEQKSNELQILKERSTRKYDLATVMSVQGQERIVFLAPNMHLPYRIPPVFESNVPEFQIECENKENVPSKPVKKTVKSKKKFQKPKYSAVLQGKASSVETFEALSDE